MEGSASPPVWSEVFSHTLVTLAYCSIALSLWRLTRGRPDRRSRRLAWMFGALFLVVGATQAAAIGAVWSGQLPPGATRLLTAGLALAIAAAVSLVLPKQVSQPGPGRLEEHDEQLRREIAERQRVERELWARKSRLEDRVLEPTVALEAANQALEREIAERKRAEQRFRRAVESSPAGMLMVDSKGTIVIANRAAMAIFGYREHELIGRPIELVVPERFRLDHPSLRDSFLRQPTTRAMGAGRDLFGRRADGSEVPIEIGLNPIHTDEGTFVLSSVVDITERKHAENLIEIKHEELERSLRDLDEFAHVVSHDLKAPLRGIVSLSSWIREDCADLLAPEARAHFEALEERTRRMSDLIDGILRYSCVAHKGGRPQEIDTAELLREVVDSLAPPETIQVRLEGTFPTVSYDRTQLRQVLQNLVSNAIQHLGRPAGRVLVSCRVESEAFVFSVRDDGPGIDERHHARLFRIFQSFDPDRPGTGVGLAIVKKIVERNGGSIRLDSTPGVGTTFEFTVPRPGRPASPLPGGARAGGT